MADLYRKDHEAYKNTFCLDVLLRNQLSLPVSHTSVCHLANVYVLGRIIFILTELNLNLDSLSAVLLTVFAVTIYPLPPLNLRLCFYF